jgi:hypothetical protein
MRRSPTTPASAIFRLSRPHRIPPLASAPTSVLVGWRIAELLSGELGATVAAAPIVPSRTLVRVTFSSTAAAASMYPSIVFTPVALLSG